MARLSSSKPQMIHIRGQITAHNFLRQKKRIRPVKRQRSVTVNILEIIIKISIFINNPHFTPIAPIMNRIFFNSNQFNIRIVKCKETKNRDPVKQQSLSFARRCRDLNPDAGHPTYLFSRQTPSPVWVHLQNADTRT